MYALHSPVGDRHELYPDGNPAAVLDTVRKTAHMITAPEVCDLQEGFWQTIFNTRPSTTCEMPS